MNSLILLIPLLVAGNPAHATADLGYAVAGSSWEEDLDGDGRKETKFWDSDGDGIPDNAEVDRDGDGTYEEYWVDTDDDGDWDRMWWDSNGDGEWDKGRFDHDGDGTWDEEWTDRNGNGTVDGNGVERDDIDAPVNGPRPIIAVAERVECDCAGQRVEPSFASSTPLLQIVLWIALGAALISVIFALLEGRSGGYRPRA